MPFMQRSSPCYNDTLRFSRYGKAQKGTCPKHCGFSHPEGAHRHHVQGRCQPAQGGEQGQVFRYRLPCLVRWSPPCTLMVTAIICTGHRHALSCGSCPPYRMTARALHTHACCNSYTAHTWDSSIFSLIGFGAGGSGIVGALAGLLACVGSSLVICCGPKSTAEGPGKFTAVRRAHSWLRRRTLTLHEPQMRPLTLTGCCAALRGRHATSPHGPRHHYSHGCRA